jgi:predicted MFS family arabinose efflux permease
MVYHMGGGLWAYIGGWSFDIAGSYRWAFMVSAVMAGIALICTLMINEARQRIRPEK